MSTFGTQFKHDFFLHNSTFLLFPRVLRVSFFLNDKIAKILWFFSCVKINSVRDEQQQIEILLWGFENERLFAQNIKGFFFFARTATTWF